MKKSFFGSVLLNTHPVLFNEEQIHLEIDHPEDEEIIKSNESYLDLKTKEVFGKKLKVSIRSPRKGASKKAISSDVSSKNVNENNPLAQAIISELGGREINKQQF